jgi:hypothetical protein
MKSPPIFPPSPPVPALAGAAAQAQAVRTERNMSLELANQIAAATVAACQANGYAVAAAVVDRAGSLRACSAPTTPARTRCRAARPRPTPRRRRRTPRWR